MKSPVISDGVCVLPGARVIGDVTLGAGSSVWYNAVIRGDINAITVGCRTNIQDCSVLHVDAGYPLVLGNDVTIGHACILHGCTIGDGVMVGQGSIVMNGAVLEPGSVVGAGSLVTGGTVIPAGALAFGRPAKVVRTLSAGEQAHNVEHAAGYAALAQQHL